MKSHLEGNVCIGDVVMRLVWMFKNAMTKRMQLQLITYLLKVFIESTYGLNFLHFIHGDPSKEGVERLNRVTLSRRGDPGVLVADRASPPQRNQLTVRANFHRAPVPLPPVEFDRPS